MAAQSDPTRPCGCSAECLARTKSSFAPGHDARLVRRLVGEITVGETQLESAARQVLTAGGSRRLIVKLISQASRVPVAWTLVTPTTALSEFDELAVQYYPTRVDRGLAPWVLLRTDAVNNEPASAPEDLIGAHKPMAFDSVYEAVAWQAKRQDQYRSSWALYRPRGLEVDPDVIDTWEWLK